MFKVASLELLLPTTHHYFSCFHSGYFIKLEFFFPLLHVVFMCFLPEKSNLQYHELCVLFLHFKIMGKITVISLSLSPILSSFSVCQFSSFSSVYCKELFTLLNSLQFRVYSFSELLRWSFVPLSTFSLKEDFSLLSTSSSVYCHM